MTTKQGNAQKKAQPKSKPKTQLSTIEVIESGISKCRTRFSKNNLAPDKIAFGREAGFAIQIIEKSEYLQKCDVRSIEDAVMNIAATGLSLNPALKHAYLVPMQADLPGYGKTWMAHLWPSYMGLQYLATSTGAVSHIEAELHCEKDFFEFIGGTDKRINHSFNPAQDRGKWLGVYCITTLHNGAKLYEYMAAEEVEKVRQVSKMKDGKPWKTWADQQWKKTVIRRASKYWPSVNPGVQNAIIAMDKLDPVDFGQQDKAEDEDQAVVLSDKDIEKLKAKFTPHEMDTATVDKWLMRLAKSEGYERIEDIPVSRLEKIESRLDTALASVKKAS